MKFSMFAKISVGAVITAAIVFFSGYGVSRPTSATALGDAPQAASGADLFAQNCARCHGEGGRGGRGPNLTSPKRQEKWKDSDEKLISKIANGGIIMPAFKKKLNADQIKSIADYVRSLKP